MSCGSSVIAKVGMVTRAVRGAGILAARIYSSIMIAETMGYGEGLH